VRSLTWKTQSLDPERRNTADTTQTTRLVLRSGDTLILRGPVIARDSLTGLRPNPGAAVDSLERVGVPLEAIHHAEAQTFDGADLVLGVAVLALLVVLTKETLRCIPWCPEH
jgi:hypothetical protein